MMGGHEPMVARLDSMFVLRTLIIMEPMVSLSTK